MTYNKISPQFPKNVTFKRFKIKVTSRTPKDCRRVENRKCWDVKKTRYDICHFKTNGTK